MPEMEQRSGLAPETAVNETTDKATTTCAHRTARPGSYRRSGTGYVPKYLRRDRRIGYEVRDCVDRLHPGTGRSDHR